MKTCLPFLLCCALLTACGDTVGGYRQAPSAPSLVEPESAAVDTRGTYLELIQRMQEQGAYYASLAHIAAFRQRHGDAPALRLLQADALRQTGQLDDARTTYESLTRSDQAAAAWHGLGLIAARRDQDAAATTALQRAAQLTPLDTAVLGDLGFARLRAGELEQAQAPLAQALELAPGDPRALANLAVWALLRDDAATAERLLQQPGLTAGTREEVLRQAQQLRQRHVGLRAHAAEAAATTLTAGNVPAPPVASAPDAGDDRATHRPRATRAMPRRVAADPGRVSALAETTAARPDTHLPATMLERFGPVTRSTENAR